MALKKRELNQLAARLGKENVLSSEADRIVYSTDVGSPPGIVDMLVNRKADAVVRCKTIQDVATAVQFCRQHRIPMTPRAAATNALGGAVPKRAGVVLDMTAMNKRVDINEDALTVTVEAGVVIHDLQEKLNAVGLELPCYPTSGLAATIGGFVATDGHGIHSTKNGNIGRHVIELNGVGADGQIFATKDHEEMSFYLGLGGSTGVLTTMTIRVQEATPDHAVMLLVDDINNIQPIVEEASKRFPAKHIMFRNADFFALRKEVGMKDPTKGKHAVLMALPDDRSDDDIAKLAARCGATVADQKVADAEWAERFFPIRHKRLGPSLVAGEVFVPVNRLADYMRTLPGKVAVDEMTMEGHVTDDGRVYFFISALDDERRPNYPTGWGTSAWILSLAKRLGGTSYQSGVWLQWESKSVFGKVRYKKLKTFKKQGDNRNLMNPGVVFPLPAPIPEFIHKAAIAGPTPAPSLGFQLAAGNPLLQYTGGATVHRRRKTIGVQAQDVAADMVRGGDLGLFSDLLWGADIPSLQAMSGGDLPMSQTVRGKLVLAKAFVQGKIVDPWTLKSALDVADPETSEVASEYAEVKEALDAFRRAVTAEGVELDVKAPEIVEEVVEVAAEESTGPKLDIEAIKEQARNTPEAEKAWVLAADCIVCNGCESACPTAAAIVTDIARVDRDLCIADGGCFDACPTDAIRPGSEDEGTSAGWPEGSRLAGKFGV